MKLRSEANMSSQQEFRNELIEKIAHWEAEIRKNHVIENDSELFQLLKSIDEEQFKTEYSSLLSIAAYNQSQKGIVRPTLVYSWMEKAIQLNPENEIAFQYMASVQWKRKNALLENLIFPPIRETDQREQKKKTARDIIHICTRFLEEGENHLDELEQILFKLKDKKMAEKYTSLISILQKAMEETGGVLKAASDFEQAISGVFHNTPYFIDMKKHMEALKELKSEWNKHFQDQEAHEKSALHQLDEMIGLTTVKTRVKNFYQFLKYQKERKDKGFQMSDEMSLNMILTGNPGTGKTTLARLLAKIYYELGVLSRQEVIEVDRSQIVGAYVGQTEENVRAIVEKALGGILFIDEAYSLKREGQTENDFGQTAIDTLVSLMTGKEYGGKFAVILAGYPDEMRQFLQSNPGLRSRFPNSNHFHLENYSRKELIQIGEKIAGENDFLLTADAKVQLAKRIEKEAVDETFGNARTVHNLILDAIFKKGAKLGDGKNILDYTLLEQEDFYSDGEQILGNPKKKLDELIGLENVKKEMEKLVSFVKMQQFRRENRLPVLPLQLHSVFLGNPGTGKTTVAKIYAEFLKEAGFLKRGHLMVASRADLVAEYVGQTAVKTKKKIREALGGVLFIDEAYSLLSKSKGDFGKEAIDTLVDEMTKHNDNLVVILAGYPNEMDELLESNPGLKSRFKKFFHFHDYSVPELIRIMEVYGWQYKYELTGGAKEYLQTELENISIRGNGRFAANLMDEAIQIQAMRLMDKGTTDVDEAMKLTEEDFAKALFNIRKEE